MIYLNVILTVKDSKDVGTVRELLAEQARLSKQEPGCQRFDVYHSKNDGRLFVIVEHWESQAALDVHREALAYTTVYKPKVIPLVDRTPHPAELIG